VNLDGVVLAIIEVVDVAAGLLHEDSLDQLAPRQSVGLPDLRVAIEPF
jgi:hypothetical protein